VGRIDVLLSVCLGEGEAFYSTSELGVEGRILLSYVLYVHMQTLWYLLVYLRILVSNIRMEKMWHLLTHPFAEAKIPCL
jgi:hypothetical protein